MYFSAADLVVLPYERILNAGADTIFLTVYGRYTCTDKPLRGCAERVLSATLKSHLKKVHSYLSEPHQDDLELKDGLYNVAMVAACPFPCGRGTPVRIQRMAEALAVTFCGL